MIEEIRSPICGIKAIISNSSSQDGRLVDAESAKMIGGCDKGVRRKKKEKAKRQAAAKASSARKATHPRHARAVLCALVAIRQHPQVRA